MQKAGFRLLQSEWWHYDDAEGGDELLDVSFGDICGQGAEPSARGERQP
jgi:hypothetical protein